MGKAKLEVGEISRAYASVMWIKRSVQWDYVLRCQELPLAVVWSMD